VNGEAASRWLREAVLYQIYPQSFADSNGDGIGDLAGIAEHLDYLAWLGVDVIWLNPCFASPFRDAGYDVCDYLSVAPRYGTNDDMAALVDAARQRGIRVLLDLVAGHTSDQHPWFQSSANDPTDHRYIWADRRAESFVASPGSRPGFYLPNFFDSQPALNFGYARSQADEPWRQPVDADGPRANRAALREILAYWLSLGVAGFRVDMAFSLVKDDPEHTETAALWREQRAWLDRAFPQAALVAEWGDPATSVTAGFHADFFLHIGGRTDGAPLRSLWDNRAGIVSERWPPIPCYFDAEGRGSTETFVTAWQEATAAVGGAGYLALPTSNHDIARLACGPRTGEQLAAAFAFQLTWPTLPAIYYGDEIGMRYLADLPDTEGSAIAPGYNRAGSRTPMQWDDGPNAGFSTAPADRLYLPVDPTPDRPTVAAQRRDPHSLLHLVHRLLTLRRTHSALGSQASLEILHTGYPLAYVRGGQFLVVVNPRRRPAGITATNVAAASITAAHPVEAAGVTLTNGEIRAAGHGWGILALHQ